MPEPVVSSMNADRTELKHHPSTRHVDAFRQGSHKAARWFLVCLWVIFLLAVFGSILIHVGSQQPLAEQLPIPRSLSALLARLRIAPTNSVVLDSAGRVVSLSEIDLRWYVGRDQAAAIIASLKDRAARINDLEDRVVRQAFLEFKMRFSAGVGLTEGAREQMKQLHSHAVSNDFAAAAHLFTDIVQGWSDETRRRVGETAIFELNYGLDELARLKREQINSLGENLHPARMHQIFFSSPVGALLEAVFWSFIGTLVNLIVNASQAKASGKFKRDEIWVSCSKLIYGPVLSFMLILTIYFGVFNAGTEMRFWLLPLLGFAFGYNTRKVAMLIDRLSEKLLGAATNALKKEAEWEARAADHASEAVRTETKPTSIAEMKQQAQRVTDSAIIAAVARQQSEL